MNNRVVHRRTRCDIPVDSVLLADAYQATLAVSGMECEECAAWVRKIVALLGGVYTVDVSLAAASVWLVYDPRRVCLHRIDDGIARAGRSGGRRFRSSLVHVGPYSGTREHHPNNITKKGA